MDFPALFSPKLTSMRKKFGRAIRLLSYTPGPLLTKLPWLNSTLSTVTPFHLQRELQLSLPPWVRLRLVVKWVKHHSYSLYWDLKSVFFALLCPLNRKLPPCSSLGRRGWAGVWSEEGALASNDLCELLAHRMLAFHLVPPSRWNRVDPNPALSQHAKGTGIWYDSHGLIGFIRSRKLEGQIQNPQLPSVFFGQCSPLSISVSPCSLQSIFSSLPLTFSFLSSTIPICSSILLSTLSLNPAILLTFQFHSSSISLPLLSSWSGL